MRRRVVITGMGAVTPLGHSVGELFQSQVEGRSGVGPITLFNASRFPTTFAAQARPWSGTSCALAVPAESDAARIKPMEHRHAL